eukprot:CFRG0055T1
MVLHSRAVVITDPSTARSALGDILQKHGFKVRMSSTTAPGTLVFPSSSLAVLMIYLDSSTQLKWDDHLERITRLESTFGQSAICAVLPEANFCDHSGLYLLMSRQASHASSSFVVPDNAVAITVILDLVKGYLKSAQTMIDDKLTRITQRRRSTSTIPAILNTIYKIDGIAYEDICTRGSLDFRPCPMRLAWPVCAYMPPKRGRLWRAALLRPKHTDL